MTTEELFAQMEAQAESEKEYCVIDPITREISVPEVYQKIGVVSDEKTNRIYFQCPRIVGDNVDLTKYGIRVNYQNANGQTKPYPVDDVAVSGDNITFSWLLERPVTTYKGTVNFVVCAIKTSGDEITNEWNTTLAQSEVLEGLEPDISITEDEESIVELLVAQCTQKLTEMNMAIQTAENATNDAKTATQEAVNATEDARSVIEQITKDSYLHTALESFINEVTAKPTAYGNALVEKIEGYIRQNQPKGYQLFDASKLPSKTQGGATVTNNGDGSFTISGSGTTGSTFAISYVLSHEETIKVLKTGSIYLKQNGNTTPYALVQLVKTDNANTWFVLNKINKQVDITEEMLNDEDSKLYYYIYCGGAEEVYGGTIKPMLYQDGDGTWEPYTGGEPAPSPDYPQVIHGVGDMGFFDGELLQGAYSAGDGSYSSANTSVCNANKIPAKQGDIVRIEYEEGNKNLYIIAYDKSGKFLKAYVESSGKSYLSTEALPANTDYVNFNIQSKESASLPVSSAKHLTVTINGMYAICVKSKGVNLFNLHGKTGKSYGAETIYGNTARIEATVENNVAPGVFFYVGDIKKFVGKTLYLRAGKITSTESSGARMVVRAIKGGASVQSFRVYQMSAAGTWMTAEIPEDFDVSTADELAVQLYVGGGVSTVTKGAVATFEEVMLCYEEHDNYIHYQSNTTYIPISSPLFAGDQLIKRNMEYKAYRKMGFAIFDGSEDEVWTEKTAEFGKCFYSRLNDAVRYKVYPDSFAKNNILQFYKNGDLSMPIYSFTFYTGELSYYKGENWIYIKLADDITSVQQAKDYLKNHNMIVVYELATPTEEDLTPEAQKAIHSIMACDEQTTIEIVGVPTDAEVQNQFLLPRNVDGALNTTAYATSKRNEVTLAEQQTATEARLQAIEAQILKEV